MTLKCPLFNAQHVIACYKKLFPASCTQGIWEIINIHVNGHRNFCHVNGNLEQIGCHKVGKTLFSKFLLPSVINSANFSSHRLRLVIIFLKDCWLSTILNSVVNRSQSFAFVGMVCFVPSSSLVSTSQICLSFYSPFSPYLFKNMHLLWPKVSCSTSSQDSGPSWNERFSPLMVLTMRETWCHYALAFDNNMSALSRHRQWVSASVILGGHQQPALMIREEKELWNGCCVALHSIY